MNDEIPWAMANVATMRPHTATTLLARARQHGVHALAARGSALDRDYRPVAPKLEPDATDEERRAAEEEAARLLDLRIRREVSDVAHLGLDLQGLPWQANLISLVGVLADFALRALERIEGLATALRTASEQRAALEREATRRADAHAAEVAALRRVIDGRDAEIATLRQQVDAARADAAAAREAKHRLTVERDGALSQVEAWRTSAASSERALEVLRVALRIQEAPAGGSLVRR